MQNLPNKTIDGTLRRNTVITIILTVIVIGSVSIWQEVSHYRKYIAELKEDLTEKRKAELKEQVDHAISFIHFEKNQLREKGRDTIRDQAYSAHSLATHIYETYKNSRSLEELEKMVIEALRPLRFNDGKGYFFATDLNGVAKLIADRPEMEGHNLINMQNADGDYVIRDMIEIARTSKEGFYSYTWSMPGAEGQDHLKISFVKYFVPFNWLIGTGLYIGDLEKEARQAAIERIDTIKFGRDGYVFAGRYDGLILTHPAKGRNMYEVTDSNGVRIVQEFIELAKDEGGFISYVMPRLGGERPFPKISYVKGISEWRWFVGAGIYVDDIETSIAEAEKEMVAGIQQSIFLILTVLISVLIVALWATTRTTRLIHRVFRDFTVLFEKAAVESFPIPPDKLEFDEFKKLAQETNSLLEKRKGAEKRLLQLEESLRQAQKMEAIGTFAGGIAHDFNNMLSTIYGYAELARVDLDLERPEDVSHDLNEIIRGSDRARDLVKQILTFSRKTDSQKQPLQAASIVKESLKLLRSSIPTTIEIRSNIATGKVVWADPTQLQQIVMNLCSNAYQAMEDEGGTLQIELVDVVVTENEELVLTSRLGPGDYVLLQVSDDGAGMDEKILDKIFEPFFTTKEHGKGTGLGLAVVHGIVQGMGGHVIVDSIKGEGTTFKVYLPVATTKNAEQETGEKTPPIGGNERILFVDDEEKVSSLWKEVLSRYGYSVARYTDPEHALHDFELNPDQYDLVITDMTMPLMTGKELARQLMEIRPDFPVILCTGYSSAIDREEALGMGIKAYCEKPLSQFELLRTIREVLDGLPKP